MANIPKTAKAMVLEEYGQPDVLREIEIPALNEGDILVKVQMAGICGTDVHQQIGDLSIKPPTPMIQGHETIGKIVDMKGVTHDVAGTPVKEGDRILWAHQFCGECYSCKILAQPCACLRSKGYGFAPPQLLRGGMAEYELITKGTDFVKIPDVVTDEEALGVGCAFRTVVKGFERLMQFGGIPTGGTVVIQGAGPIGLYSTVMAAQSGAAKIVVVDGFENRLEFAKRWGATDVISMKQYTDTAARVEYLKSITNGLGADVVIEATGAPVAILEGFEYLVPKFGKYLVLGQTSRRGVEIIPNDILVKDMIIIGSMSADIRHFVKALKFIEANREKYPFGELISTKYALEEANEAMANMLNGKDLKAALDMRDR
ncbi:MAG: alcohol dehydrogenase catalytic domain-containing protein [Mogibacterium sp.]|nr:alcohol dehydrogenase catalytic domain-containing protein [Mogibacterium sp.]